MSNPNVPFGFQYIGLVDGNSPTFGVKSVQISASNTNSIFGGDVAKVISGGYFDVAAEVGGGGPIGGIFLPHFSWLSKTSGSRVRQRAWLGQTGDIAGGAVDAKVVIARDALFRVRAAGTSGVAVAQTNVGQNANFYVGAAPGNNLVSTFGLDDLTLGVGPSLPFTVYDLEQAPTSDPASIYNIVIVRLNNLAIL